MIVEFLDHSIVGTVMLLLAQCMFSTVNANVPTHLGVRVQDRSVYETLAVGNEDAVGGVVNVDAGWRSKAATVQVAIPIGLAITIVAVAAVRSVELQTSQEARTSWSR